VIVRDEVKCVAFVLELDGSVHHAEVIADVESAAGLKA
jgi:hypothetical protein